MAFPSARNEIDAARALLAPHLRPTPLVRAASLDRGDAAVRLKIETGLPTGSFKVRGAIYALSTESARAPIGEVVAASTGNHGAAVAYAARLLHLKATIFLPCHPNPVKAARIHDLGADLVEHGADLSAAIDAAYLYCERTGAFFLHDATDPRIPIGTATIGAEILDEQSETTAIYVPIGDTALIRGVAAAVKLTADRANRVRIVGVVAERAPAYALGWRSGVATETASADTIADGLAVRRALAPNVAAIRTLVDEVRTVSEDEMLDAIDWLESREGLVVEPSGAAPTAAWRQGDGDAGAGNRVVLLVTGGNVSPETTALVDARRRRAPVPRP